MTRSHRPDDPSAERTHDGSGAQEKQPAQPDRSDENLIGRTKEEHPTTPRRYDQDRDDPAMPADDSALRTEM